MLVGRDVEVVATLLDGDAELAESIGYDAKIGDADILDGDLACGHGCHADE